MKLEKWQALGNDYLICEAQALPFALSPERIRHICAQHFGLAADGILLVQRTPEGPATATLRIFNPDGSEAELSGNGAREAALYMHSHGWSSSDRFSISTAAGIIGPEVLADGRCSIEMGTASVTSKDYPQGAADGLGEIAAGDTHFAFQHVSVGNPQCSIHVADVDALAQLDLQSLGPPIEASDSFPNRTNVSWYAELDAQRIRARIFERGVGETMASGTGAAGAAVAHALRTGQTAQCIIVEMEGGELEVEISAQLAIRQTGWALPVYAALLSEPFLAELEGL